MANQLETVTVSPLKGILMLSVQSCIAIRLDFTMWLRAEVMHINDSWMADIRSIWCSPMAITKFIQPLHPYGG